MTEDASQTRWSSRTRPRPQYRTEMLIMKVMEATLRVLELILVATR
jgi:hypothetical protein